jgi:hypothetical protein
VALSSAEVEYVNVDHAASDLTWTIKLAQQWHIPLRDPPSATEPPSGTANPRAPFTLHIDRKGAVDMASASGPTKHTRHIDAKQSYIQQQMKSNILTLVQVPSADQKADIFTIAPPRVQFCTTSPN